MMKLRPYLHITLLHMLLLAGCGGAKTNEITVRLQDMHFYQDQIQATAGQPITLNLVNKDSYAHTFDIDEMDIHTPLAANETLEITFTPDKPGRYTFYCGSPGHQTAGMIGTLIVEP